MIDSANALIAAALAAAAVGDGGPSPTAPIYLTAEPSGDGIHVRVVGSSEREYEAVYTLEVTSGPGPRGNRSVQRGRALLRGGVPHTFISVRLGDVRPGAWEARLRVEPREGAPYEEVRHSL